MMTRLTFSKERIGFMFDALGLAVDEDGYVVDESGEYVPTTTDCEKLHEDNVAAFVHDESVDCNTRLVPDNFPAIVDYVRDREHEEWSDPREIADE